MIGVSCLAVGVVSEIQVAVTVVELNDYDHDAGDYNNNDDDEDDDDEDGSGGGGDDGRCGGGGGDDGRCGGGGDYDYGVDDIVIMFIMMMS